MQKSRVISSAIVAVGFSAPSVAQPFIDGRIPIDRVSGSVAIGDTNAYAQTFTTPEAGRIDFIGVSIYRNPGATADVAYRLIELSGNALPNINTAAIAEGEISIGDIPLNPDFPQGVPSSSPLTTIDISDAGIDVSAGDNFAIMLLSQNSISDFSTWVTWLQGVETFDGGMALSSFDSGTTFDPFRVNLFEPDTFDLGFTVNVIPAPSVGSVGLLSAFLISRRRRG
ncbi:MAG: hypothetical protein AAFN41_13560 [Planctomycetota bacterium]